MIKDGAKDVTLSYLAAAPRHRLALNTFTDGMSPTPESRHAYIASALPMKMETLV